MKVSQAVRHRNPHVDFNKLKAKKPSKYRNKKTIVDGITFDSGWEAERWGVLKLLERAGVITNLQRQVRYEFYVNGYHICDYYADSEYMQDDELVVEDTKSPTTRKLPEYRIKIKLMLALYGIVVQEKVKRD